MKQLGLMMIFAGFIAGALVAVREHGNVVNWYLFAPAILVAIGGVVLTRIAMRQQSQHADTLKSNVQVLHSSIDEIIKNIAQLDGEKESLHPYDVHSRIDDLFPDHINQFVESRDAIGHVFGLQAYASVMNEFAAGERYLNRVWSASVDCYIDDVHEFLGRAKCQFELARDRLSELSSHS